MMILDSVDIKKIIHPMASKADLIRGDALSALDVVQNNSYQLVISSPPYNIGKIYEKKQRMSFATYLEWQDKVVGEVVKKVTETGSVCWQVGNYIDNGEVVPLDVKFYEMFAARGLKLRNRIIWRFNFGYNLEKRLSGRYETLLWFTKSDKYQFNLDAVRIPQIYPGKRHAASKGDKAGKPSGNPRGKNPSDFWEFSAKNDFIDDPVWNIPNVKAGHPEKTTHPAQFPIELVERCVLAFTDVGDRILDPFVGTGTSIVAALKHGRIGTGIDKEDAFLGIASERIAAIGRGELRMRPAGLPIRRPISSEKVSIPPLEWLDQQKLRTSSQ